jgi:hypothetical protein
LPTRLTSGPQAIFLTALTFGFTGPAFGTAAYLIWGLSLSDEPILPLEVLSAGLWMLPLGYLIGFIPAALTGLVVGGGRRWLTPATYVVASAIAAFVMTWGLSLLEASDPSSDSGGVTLGVIGALAGVLSALASLGLGRLKTRSTVS